MNWPSCFSQLGIIGSPHYNGKMLRKSIQGVKSLTPGMVSPPIAWLKNEIEQFAIKNVDY